MLSKFKNVYVLAPHTDDGELGAGGTIAKLIEIGVKYAEQRGVDSSRLIHLKDSGYQVDRADLNVEKLLGKVNPYNSNVLVGANKAKILDAFNNNSTFSNANTALDLYGGGHASERIVTELLNGS
jgi:hypothetical protein